MEGVDERVSGTVNKGEDGRGAVTDDELIMRRSTSSS